MEILSARHRMLSLATMPEWLGAIRQRLGCSYAFVEARFPWTVERAAPVSGQKAGQVHDAWLRAEGVQGADRFWVGVKTPVTGLCPCSRAVSDYGAHNQRVYVTLEIECAMEVDGCPASMDFGALAAIAENAGSAPIYPLLKRPDERHVTMRAYDNPAFVEDIVRRAAASLSALRAGGDRRIKAFLVEAAAMESIHAHDVFASVRG
jgi:GTP cyclohydrolase I